MSLLVIVSKSLIGDALFTYLVHYLENERNISLPITCLEHHTDHVRQKRTILTTFKHLYHLKVLFLTGYTFD